MIWSSKNRPLDANATTIRRIPIYPPSLPRFDCLGASRQRLGYAPNRVDDPGAIQANVLSTGPKSGTLTIGARENRQLTALVAVVAIAAADPAFAFVVSALAVVMIFACPTVGNGKGSSIPGE